MSKYLSLLLLIMISSCIQKSPQPEKTELESTNVSPDSKEKISQNQAKSLDQVNELTEINRESNGETYSLGASEGEVIRIQGQPTSTMGSSSRRTYYYGVDYVEFENGKLVNYNNYDGALAIKITPNNTDVSESPKSIVAPKGKTKYVYFFCFVRELDIEIYYSKIFKIPDYNEDKLFEIKNCLVEKIRFFKQQSGKVDMFENIYDSYSAASEKWNSQTGFKIFGDESCGL